MLGDAGVIVEKLQTGNLEKSAAQLLKKKCLTKKIVRKNKLLVKKNNWSAKKKSFVKINEAENGPSIKGGERFLNQRGKTTPISRAAVREAGVS